MITREVTVKSADWLNTKDGSKEYLSAVLVDTENQKESKQSIFDPDLQKSIQWAFEKKLTLSVKLEKEGQFWNLKQVEIISPPSPVSPSSETPQKSEKPVQRNTWDAEVWTTRRCCLMQAVDLTKFYMNPEMGLAEAVKCVADTYDKLLVALMATHADKEGK
jgi:hypothetical protein